MTGSTRPRIRVSVLPSDKFTRVEFWSSVPSVPTARLTIKGRDRLERALEVLDSGLYEVKQALPGLDASDYDLIRVYAAFEELADELLYALFGNAEAVIYKLQDFWRSALPFARNSHWREVLVQCVADTPFPLEYLPLLAGPARPAPGSRAEWLDQFRAYIGFSCLVQRMTHDPQSAGALRLARNQDGELPVRYLQYDALAGARQELGWFNEPGRRIKVEGPYPDTKNNIGLPQQIFDPRILLDGSVRELPDQIQHFACHCYTKAKSPLDSEIELSGSGQSVRIRLRDIGKDLVRLLRKSPHRDFDLPLVFINACGAARIRADSAFSFPQLFLDNRNRGFIGTEIEMPDDVAWTFSQAFYERFLQWGRPLGSAMLGARRDLLYRHGNPLGIAYTSYADPELHARSINAGDT